MTPSSAPSAEALHPAPLAADPDGGVLPTGGSGPKAPHWRSRRARIVAALAAVLLAGAALAVFLLPSGNGSGTPLGAAASVPGGLARVNGVLPLETDGWLPPERVPALEESPQSGAHRVRILVEVTALDADGVAFTADEFAISGLGSGRPELLWADPAERRLPQGQSVTATLVFEIPNQAVTLSLDGPGGAKLALGVGHHTPGS